MDNTTAQRKGGVSGGALTSTGPEGHLLLSFKSHDTVTANGYCHTLRKLCTMTKNKHLGRLIDSSIVLHNNAHPHAAH
jgi:hypothetical protein